MSDKWLNESKMRLLRNRYLSKYVLLQSVSVNLSSYLSPSSEVILDSELCLLSISTTVSEPWHCSSKYSRPVERKLSFHTRFSLWYLFTRETWSFTKRKGDTFFFPINTVKRAAEQSLSRAMPRVGVLAFLKLTEMIDRKEGLAQKWVPIYFT